MDIKWIFWQAFIPLISPIIVWFAVCWARSSLGNTPPLNQHLKTWKYVIEEYGWLMYAVFVSLQSGLSIHDAVGAPQWIFWLNISVLAAGLLILAVAFFTRFEDSESKVVLKPSHEVPIQSFQAGFVAVSAAIIGYLTMSAGKIL